VEYIVSRRDNGQSSGAQVEMDNFEDHEVILAFKHRGRAVQLRASARGWAAMYLKENPWTGRRRQNLVELAGRIPVVGNA